MAAAVLLVAIGLGSSDLRAQEALEDVFVVPVIRVPVYDQFNEAQTCLEQDDVDCAMSLLDELAEAGDLNTYETAALYNFYAAIYTAEDDLGSAIEAYEAILALPADEIPEALVQQAGQNLAELVRRARNALALRGVYRFGDVYRVSVQLGYGSVHSVTWESGRTDAVPVGNGYLVEGVEGRSVTLGLPEDRNCEEDFRHVGRCIGTRQVVLSLSE